MFIQSEGIMETTMERSGEGIHTGDNLISESANALRQRDLRAEEQRLLDLKREAFKRSEQYMTQAGRFTQEMLVRGGWPKIDGFPYADTTNIDDQLAFIRRRIAVSEESGV